MLQIHTLMERFTTGLVALLCLASQSLAFNKTCGQTKFHSNSGKISSVGLIESGSYKPGLDCKYEIKVRGDRWVKLSFTKFNVNGVMPDCNNDYLEVFIGCDYPASVSRFCSNNAGLPHDIYAIDGCITMRFKSQSADSRTSPSTGAGFQAEWESRPRNQPVSTKKCSSNRDITSRYKSYTIVTPGWPVNYKSKYVSWGGSCEWDFETSSTRRIKLNIMDVDLFRDSGSCSAISSDKMRIEGKKSVITSGRSRDIYCKERKPFSIDTEYYELDIEFDASFLYNRPNRGFVVGYITYQDELATQNTKMGIIIGGVLLILFFCAFAFFCIRRHRRQAHDSVVTTTTVIQANSATPLTHDQAPGTEYTKPYSDTFGPPPAYPGPPTEGVYQGYYQPPYAPTAEGQHYPPPQVYSPSQQYPSAPPPGGQYPPPNGQYPPQYPPPAANGQYADYPPPAAAGPYSPPPLEQQPPHHQ